MALPLLCKAGLLQKAQPPVAAGSPRSASLPLGAPCCLGHSPASPQSHPRCLGSSLRPQLPRGSVLPSSPSQPRRSFLLLESLSLATRLPRHLPSPMSTTWLPCHHSHLHTATHSFDVQQKSASGLSSGSFRLMSEVPASPTCTVVSMQDRPLPSQLHRHCHHLRPPSLSPAASSQALLQPPRPQSLSSAGCKAQALQLRTKARAPTPARVPEAPPHPWPLVLCLPLLQPLGPFIPPK